MRKQSKLITNSWFKAVNIIYVFLLFCALFIILNQFEYLIKDLKNTEWDLNEKDLIDLHDRLVSSGFIRDSTSSSSMTVEDERIQKITRQKVVDLFGVMKNQNIEKYLKEFYVDGSRKYSIVLSSWRSGSSFFGDFLQSVPGTFYHYEPLINNVNMVRPPNDTAAISSVENFLQCNFSNSQQYFDFMKVSIPVFEIPIQIGNVYKSNEDIAIQEKFVTPICKIYPFQSMKIIRLRLASFSKFFEENLLNSKLILLVRDPRAVMNSRKNLEFCTGTPDCAKAETLCSDMTDNYQTALEFSKMYPNNFKVLRYEDMFNDLETTARKILDFYELPFTRNSQAFLDSHTRSTQNELDPFSTFRDAKAIQNRWIKELNYDEVEKIQSSCSEALKLWGYHRVDKQDFLIKNLTTTLPFSDFPF